jgi:hypothetical protein
MASQKAKLRRPLVSVEPRRPPAHPFSTTIVVIGNWGTAGDFIPGLLVGWANVFHAKVVKNQLNIMAVCFNADLWRPSNGKLDVASPCTRNPRRTLLQDTPRNNRHPKHSQLGSAQDSPPVGVSAANRRLLRDGRLAAGRIMPSMSPIGGQITGFLATGWIRSVARTLFMPASILPRAMGTQCMPRMSADESSAGRDDRC